MAELENDMCPSPLCAKFSATSAGPVREELLTASPADVECADVELTDETGEPPDPEETLRALSSFAVPFDPGLK